MSSTDIDKVCISPADPYSHTCILVADGQITQALTEAPRRHISIYAMDTSRVFQVSIFFQGKLAQATESFSENRRIGGGGFGDVYMTSRGMTSILGLGSLHDYVAIKKLNSASLQGQSEFLKEIQVQGGCRHENLLVLLGFSADNGVIQGREGFCLVTPLMRGGSLQDRLVLDASARNRLSKLPETPAGGFTPLTWSQRLTVALGALSGLAYLHTPDPATQKPVVLHGVRIYMYMYINR